MDEKRLFFALWPDDRQRDTLRNALRPIVPTLEGKPVDRRSWHVTLVFIGAFSERRIDELLQAVSGIRCPPIRLRFDKVTYYARPKIAWLEAMTVPAELGSLVTQLEISLEPYGFRPENRTYRPHITVARKVRAFEAQSLARPMEFTWSDFQLMESVSTPRGVQYRPLKQ